MIMAEKEQQGAREKRRKISTEEECRKRLGNFGQSVIRTGEGREGEVTRSGRRDKDTKKGDKLQECTPCQDRRVGIMQTTVREEQTVSEQK